MSDIHNTLRERRLAAGLTQAGLAVKSGVDQKTISDIERGYNRTPSWEKVGCLARALGVPPDLLFPLPQHAPQESAA